MAEKDPFDMINQVSEDIDMSDVAESDAIEKQSYSRYSYNRVKKAREKGLSYGVDIPYLKYSVDSPDKARTLFLILGVISAVFLVASIAFVTFFVITNLIPMICNLIGVTEQAMIRVEYDIFAIGPALGSIMSVFLWVLVLIIIAAFVGELLFFIYLTRRMFAMSKFSIQEMAVGHEIKNSIRSIIIIMVIIASIMIGLFVLVEDMPTKAVLVVLGIGLGIMALCATLLTFLILEKKKANKKFMELPYEEQEDFMVHARAYERVCKKKKVNHLSSLNSGFDF
ncbi:MAG: hypothetical protein E7361_01545 [Clostridiales bacterium]|nr:hypothetical protein [Clostridiales bacterium]